MKTVTVFNKLAHAYLRRTMAGSKPTTTASDLVDDQRKKRAVVRDLMKTGYLEESAGDFYTITPKAYDELPADRPNLAQQYEKKACPDEVIGVPFLDLSLWEQKYVWKEQAHYQFHIWDSSRRISSNVAPSDSATIIKGIYEARGQQVLTVSDSEARKARDTKLFQKRLLELKKRNFAWGLNKAGILTEEEARHITVSDASPFGDRMHFSMEPENWRNELPVLADNLRSRIRGDSMLLDTLGRLENRLRAYGGWDKFLADYETGLIAEIRKDMGVKVKPSNSTEVQWQVFGETFGFLFTKFDVDKAKEILRKSPHDIDILTLDTAKNWIGDEKRFGLIRVDWARVNSDEEINLEIPVILAHLKVGTEAQRLPIDGWTRIARAIKVGLETLPCCALTEAETDAVKL